MMSLWDALRMNMMISYQELVRTFPNAQTFYEKHGFKLMQESMYPSALAQAELRCMEMSINLLG
ncbi:hypothetical protein ACYZCU_28690, partial [Klebsiella pneumoniae]